MSDLIDRVAVLEDLEKRMADDYVDAARFAEYIRTLPSAEPERHRGEWIEDEHERGYSECSKCGYIAVSVLSRRLYNYCPNCGARMTRGDNDEEA
jgi:predicted RNA-binding Zn-ribbon protein involved in translation (DUF1610 family)